MFSIRGVFCVVFFTLKAMADQNVIIVFWIKLCPVVVYVLLAL